MLVAYRRERRPTVLKLGDGGRTAGTIAALLLLREHVIAPVLASVGIMGRIPITHLDRVDRDYQKNCMGPADWAL